MNRVYIHVATLGRYQHILDELTVALVRSGLSDKAEIAVGIVGDFEVVSNYYSMRLGSIDLYEFPTLGVVQDYSRQHPDDNFLYIHTKGASTPQNEAISDWRQYMTYFCVDQWDRSTRKLDDGYDCVGVDWRTDPAPHYSGNFWWAKGRHLSNLPDIRTMGQPDAPHTLSRRHNAEFWIGMRHGVNALSMWDCGISQYERHLHCYPKEKYGSV